MRRRAVTLLTELAEACWCGQGWLERLLSQFRPYLSVNRRYRRSIPMFDINVVVANIVAANIDVVNLTLSTAAQSV